MVKQALTFFGPICFYLASIYRTPGYILQGYPYRFLLVASGKTLFKVKSAESRQT